MKKLKSGDSGDEHTRVRYCIKEVSIYTTQRVWELCRSLVAFYFQALFQRLSYASIVHMDSTVVDCGEELGSGSVTVTVGPEACHLVMRPGSLLISV